MGSNRVARRDGRSILTFDTKRRIIGEEDWKRASMRTGPFKPQNRRESSTKLSHVYMRTPPIFSDLLRKSLRPLHSDFVDYEHYFPHMQRVRQETIAKWRALATAISNSLRLTMLIAATHTAIGKKIIAVAKFRSCLGSLSILLAFFAPLALHAEDTTQPALPRSRPLWHKHLMVRVITLIWVRRSL